MIKRLATPCLLVAVVALVALTDRAARAEDAAEAAALYDRGMADLVAGKIAQGCGELHASLDSHRDVVTEAALAGCDTALGKLGSAWRLWQAIAAASDDADARAAAIAKAGTLADKLPKVRFVLPPGAPSDLRLSIDGDRLTGAVTGTAFAVDPGPFTVAARADGRRTWQQSFTATGTETVTVTIPGLPPSGAPVDPPAHGPRSHAGFALVIGGGALTVGGLIVGGVALSRWHSALDLCNGLANDCTTASLPDAKSRGSSARSLANTSTIVVGAGVVAAGAGVLLLLLGNHAAAEAPRSHVVPVVDTQSLGLSWQGSFE